MPTKTEKQCIGIWVSIDLKKRISRAAAKERRTMSEFLRLVIEDDLDNRELSYKGGRT